MRRGEGREAIVSRGADDRSKGAKGVLRQGGHQHGERRAVVVLDAAAHDPEPDGADPGGDAAALAQEGDDAAEVAGQRAGRSEEHTSELQSLMRISYAVFCLKKKKHNKSNN